MSEIPEGAEVRSAIIWFDGIPEGDERFATAIAAGGWRLVDDDGSYRAWPAAVDVIYASDRQQHYGRRLGIDVEQRCLVVEVHDFAAGMEKKRERVLVNLDAMAAVLQLGRIATGQTPGA